MLLNLRLYKWLIFQYIIGVAFVNSIVIKMTTISPYFHSFVNEEDCRYRQNGN